MEKRKKEKKKTRKQKQTNGAAGYKTFNSLEMTFEILVIIWCSHITWQLVRRNKLTAGPTGNLQMVKNS